MIISSKFRDYYDHITAFGIDKTIVYNRDKKECKIKGKGLPELPRVDAFQVKNVKFEATFKVVGFCGKIYPVIMVERTAPGENPSLFFLYSLGDASNFLKKFDLQEKGPIKYYWRRNCHLRSSSELSEFFDKNSYSFLLSVFSEQNVPVFVWYDTKGSEYRNNLALEIVLNPKLRDYDFVRAVDPVTAFQELMLYISGVLTLPAVPMVKLSDKELAKKRGHDGKYSFKKPPADKKKKK